MKCPSCGLTNPPEAMRCDCGFNFSKNIIDKPFQANVPSDRHHQPTIKGLSCPKCRGIAKGHYSGLIWVFGILLFPIGLLLFLTRKTYTCNGCGYKFKT
jgi:hypothetical protein